MLRKDCLFVAILFQGSMGILEVVVRTVASTAGGILVFK